MKQVLKAKARRERRAPMGVDANVKPRPARGRTTSTTTPVTVRNTTAHASIDREWLRQRLGFKLGKFAARIDRTTVSLRDESGPAGEPTLRATVTLTVARGEPIATSARGRTPAAAISTALRASERAMRRATERRRTATRAKRPTPARPG